MQLSHWHLHVGLKKMYEYLGDDFFMNQRGPNLLCLEFLQAQQQLLPLQLALIWTTHRLDYLC